MSGWLRQSTAVDIALGPFLDDTDGKTAETGLTISQADVRLKKNAGNWAQKNQASAATHEENGWYEVSLNTTDTDTLGVLVVAVHEAGALPVFATFMVLPANVYDSLVPGTDTLDVQVTGMGAGVVTAAAVATDAIDADALADGAITSGVFASGAITAAAIAADAIGASELAADAVTEIQSGLATAAALTTVDDFLDTEIAAIKAKTDNLPATPASQGDVAAVAAYVDTEIASIISTLATIAGYLDTEVAAILAAVDTEIASIKAKTDNLPAAPAATGDIPSAATVAAAVAALVSAVQGTAQGGTTTTVQLATGASASDDAYNGRLVFLVYADGTKDFAVIDDYTGATRTATLNRTLAAAPISTTDYLIFVV